MTWLTENLHRRRTVVGNSVIFTGLPKDFLQPQQKLVHVRAHMRTGATGLRLRRGIADATR